MKLSRLDRAEPAEPQHDGPDADPHQRLQQRARGRSGNAPALPGAAAQRRVQARSSFRRAAVEAGLRPGLRSQDGQNGSIEAGGRRRIEHHRAGRHEGGAGGPQRASSTWEPQAGECAGRSQCKSAASTTATKEDAQWSRGFYVVPADPKKPDSALDIVSKFGEISLQMSDGARYVLRFGNTTGASSTGNTKDKKLDAKEGSPGMDRYLFVMVDFNQDAIPKPAVEQLPPEEKPAAKKPDKQQRRRRTLRMTTRTQKGRCRRSRYRRRRRLTRPRFMPRPRSPLQRLRKADAGTKAGRRKDAGRRKKADAKKDEPKEMTTPPEAAEKAKLRKAEQERIDKEKSKLPPGRIQR